MPIIEVNSLSKKYSITANNGRYQTLRDSMADLARHPVKALSGKFRKKEEFWALNDVSFNVEQGEVLGVIGANGAGKSTLLKILSRITPPTSGEIRIKGRVASLLEVGTGFHPELTGRENIFLNGAILGMHKKEIARKFDEIVDFSGVEKFLDTPVKFYSSGMYVRLAFSVAAHMEPDILLIDEVLAVGDAEFQKKCLGKMDEVTKQSGRTIIFVSHNMGALKSICEKGLIIEDGKILQLGNINQVANNYISKSVVVDSINEFEYDSSKTVQIRKVSVLDDTGKNSSEIDIAKPFSVQIKCDIRENLNERNYVGINLYDTNNSLILQCFDVDDNESYYLKRPKGTYLISYHFPGYMFNTFVCKIKVKAGIKSANNSLYNPEKYFDQANNIYFKFVKSAHFSDKFFNGQRFGFFSIPIKCRVQKKE